MATSNIHEESRILYLARALYDAVEDCNIQQVNILLSRNKANPNVVIPEKGMTAFHLAAGHEHLVFGKIVCALFLRNDGDPNICCEGNRTVLHIAVAWNRSLVVETLLKSSYIVPDLYIEDENGFNVFHYAIQFNSWESLAILQSAIKRTKSMSSNNTIQSKYIEKDESIFKTDLKSIGISSPFNETNRLRTSSEYLNSGVCCNDTSISIKSSVVSLQNSFDVSTINDILNKKISTNYIYNASVENISSVDKSIMNSIKPNFELITENVFNPLNELYSNNTEWMTDISEYSSCEEYFTCPETDPKQQDDNCRMENSNMSHNIAKISLHNLTRSFSEVSLDMNNLEMANHYTSSDEASSNLTEISNDYDTDYIKYNLRKFGHQPGPIVATTKQLYLRKLNRIKRNPELNANDNNININSEYSYSSQLQKVLNNDQNNDTWKNLLTHWSTLENDIILNQNGSSFIYLLLDPRITKNLPGRVDLMNNSIEIWQTFIKSIFYIGKGTSCRPNDHIREAFNSWITKSDKHFSPKTEYILNLWKEKMGIVCVQAFHNLTQKEANVREAAMIDAIGLKKLTNEKHGTYYYNSKKLTTSERCKLGSYLLYRTMGVFLANGERQLQPIDLT